MSILLFYIRILRNNSNFFYTKFSLLKLFRSRLYEVDNVENLYDDLMNLIVRFAQHGVIHGDFNEFNIMINDEEKPIVIDFPQMVSVTHANAKM